METNPVSQGAGLPPQTREGAERNEMEQPTSIKGPASSSILASATLSRDNTTKSFQEKTKKVNFFQKGVEITEKYRFWVALNLVNLIDSASLAFQN